MKSMAKAMRSVARAIKACEAADRSDRDWKARGERVRRSLDRRSYVGGGSYVGNGGAL